MTTPDWLIIDAIRHALGRNCSRMDATCDWIVDNWPKFSDGVKSAVQREVETVIADDELWSVEFRRLDRHDLDRVQRLWGEAPPAPAFKLPEQATLIWSRVDGKEVFFACVGDGSRVLNDKDELARVTLDIPPPGCWSLLRLAEKGIAIARSPNNGQWYWGKYDGPKSDSLFLDRDECWRAATKAADSEVGK